MGQGLWLIKDRSGKIFGPYEYAKLEGFVEKGLISGDEMIASYPEGEWTLITKDLNLYSKILDQLAKTPSKKQQDEIHKEFIQANATQTKPPNQDPETSATAASKKGGPKLDVVADEDWADTSEATNSTQSFVTSKTIEVQEKSKPKVTQRLARLSLILLLVALAIFYQLKDKNLQKDSEVTFIAPSFAKTLPPDSAQEQKRRFLQYLSLYMEGGKSNYIYLREQLIPFLEKNKSNVDAIALLCLAYRELWPYSSKGSKELAVLSKLLEQSSRAEAYSASATTCNAVIQLVRGDLNGADSIIKRVLVQDSNAVTFYDMQAEVLERQAKKNEAIRYLQKAQSLWPNWQKPKISEALTREELGQPAAAKQILETVLKASEEQEAAATLLAYIELTHLRSYQNAKLFIRAFKKDESNARPKIVAKGYHVLALLAQQEGDKSKASNYANLSLSIEANNPMMQQLLASFGKATAKQVVKGTSADLIENGDRYFAQGRYLEAQAEYKAAFEIDPKNASAAFKAAESLWKLDQEKEAIAWMNRAVNSDKKYLEAHLRLAEFYAERFDFLSAANQMLKAQRVNSKDFKIFRTYALIELKRFNYAGAIKQAEVALQRYDGDTESLEILTRSYLATNMPREAHYAISKAVALESTNPHLQALYAYSLSKFQNADAGVRYITNLIHTYPSVLEYRESLGRIYLEDDKYREAIQVLQQIVDAGYKNIEAYYLMAEAYQKLNDAQNTLKTLLMAAQERPSKVETYVRIGILQQQAKNHAQAVKQFSVARELNENYPRLNSMMGESLLKLGKHGDALKLAEQEMRRNPKLADGYLLAGDIYTAMGQYSKAAGEYQKVVSINPNSADLYVKIARSHRLAGNYDVAKSMLAVASAKESGYAEIYKESGALLEAMGSAREAIDSYLKYLKLSPNAADQQEIRRIIQGLGG